MEPRNHPKKLLVEGRTDELVFPYLMELAGVPWPNPPKHPVDITELGGFDEIVREGVIELYFKSSGTRAVGVIVDADSDCQERFDSLRAQCIQRFPGMPQTMPPEGLILENVGGQRLGIWIMPDNTNIGMLESFLRYLLKPADESLWNFAIQTVNAAKTEGAAFRDVEIDKARIHTWLAWQSPPGRQLHEALRDQLLTVETDLGTKFAEWFRKLYELPSPV